MTTPNASLVPVNVDVVPTCYGVPTDAMFTTTPADGQLCAREDGVAGTSVLYVRVAGVWAAV